MPDGFELAYKNIDELPTLAAPATGDFLVIWDVSTQTFAKIDAEYYAAA